MTPELQPQPTASASRRRFLRSAGIFAAALGGASLWPAGWAEAASGRGGPTGSTDPILAGRPLVRYPEKTDLILLTSRPPQLETPMRYFEHAITPNEAFFVRYHISGVPTHVDLGTWRLKVSGVVERPLSLSLDDLRTQFPPVKLVAVNQCSGNGRGRFEPRVFGGQWSGGAMGCAEWTGARLQDILKLAGLKAGAQEVTFNGLDTPPAPGVADLVKSLTVSHIQESPEILVAYEMNGKELPMLNGFPARVIVPGWYSTYWVKNLSDITVLDHPFDGFWMIKAYRIPATPCGCVEPGAAPARTVPINRMKVKSVIAAPEDGARLPAGKPVDFRGVAFDGGYGVTEVLASTDRGATWRPATLGADLGPYAFREWSYRWTPPRAGAYRFMVRATNRVGESQPMKALWNPGGYLRNVIEHVDVTAI